MALRMREPAPVAPDARDWDMTQLADDVNDAMGGVLCDVLLVSAAGEAHCTELADQVLAVAFPCGARAERAMDARHAEHTKRGYLFCAEHPEDIDDRAVIVSSTPVGA